MPKSTGLLIDFQFQLCEIHPVRNVGTLMPFVKLDTGILDSSIWKYCSDTRIVWITLLAMCEQDGMIRAAIPAIARRACVSEDEAAKAIEIFLSPDSDSRCTDVEGRRLTKVDGGYMVVNYLRYRSNGRPDVGTGVGSNPTTFDTKGKIYFIQCANSVKIGFSQNPWARLNSIKTGTPESPSLLGHIPGSISLERQLHERFKGFRSHGEWFRLEGELRQYIEGVLRLPVAKVATASSDRSAEAEADAYAYADAETSKPLSAKAEKSRAQRLPKDFRVTDEHRRWASEHSMPSPDLHVEEFRDYWFGIGGQRGTKLDWDGAFRNWIRKASERRNGNGYQRESAFDRAIRKMHEKDAR